MTVAAAPRDHAWRPGVIDVAAALVMIAIGAQVLASAGTGNGFRASDAVAHALTAIGCGAIVWARRQPSVALLVSGLAATALVSRDYHVDVLPFVVTGLLFMVASYRSRREAILALAATGVFLAISAATEPADLGVDALAQTSLIFLVVWVLGVQVRGRRTALLGLVSEAEQRAVVERELAAAERDRATLSLVEERLNIARDLHDVLAHSMGVISVQATVGAHLADDDPAAARQALLTIGDVTRSSLGDLRQMLTLLRNESSAALRDDVTYDAAPGLAAVEPLIQTYRDAGLPVSITTHGDPQALSASADLCAYRIIQEALTNTLKHAGDARATVTVTHRPDAVEIDIADDGKPTAASAGGHGLIGMRERAALVGGRLDVGPAPGGGFAVRAVLPRHEGADTVHA